MVLSLKILYILQDIKFLTPKLEICLYHHHLVVASARISLTLSRHPSLSFNASSRSPGLHPVSSQSCCMYVSAGRPAFARPCEGVHRSTSLMSLYLLLQQCPACLVRLTWIIFMMGGMWPYSCCFVGCCLQEKICLLTFSKPLWDQKARKIVGWFYSSSTLFG